LQLIVVIKQKESKMRKMNFRGGASRKLSVILALAMVLSVFTALPMAAYADEPESGDVYFEQLVPEAPALAEEDTEGVAEAVAEESGSEEPAPSLGEVAEEDEPSADPGADWPTDNNITAGGEYTIPTAFTGTITISTSDPVTLIGQGTATGNAFVGVSITYGTGNNAINLTLQDVYISSPLNGGAVINYTGTGNSLTVANTYGAILESNGYSNLAAVHVGPGTALTLHGPASANTATGKGLFVYKSSGSAAIGGNTLEASGAITFADGYIFIKGSQTGAVVGGDSSTVGANDVITFSGAIVNIEANARGAAVGASNQGQCAGTVNITGGNVAITCDYRGPAIGHGDTGTQGGTLNITGGSLLVTLTANSIGSGLTPDTAINATLNGAVQPTDGAPLIYAPASPTTPFTLTADGYAYSGIINQYVYTSSTYTPGNWTINTSVVNGSNSSVYAYIPIADTQVSINGASSVDIHEINFTYDDTAVRVLADQYNPIGEVRVVDGSNLTFTATALVAGQTVTVTVNGSVLSPVGGVYTISNISADKTVVITTEAPNTVTFNAPSGTTVYVNDVAVTSTVVPYNATLDFTVVTPIGQKVTAVYTGAAPGLPVPQIAGNTYELANVIASATVTITVGSDATAWYNTATTAWYTTAPAASTYTIASATDFAGLAKLVHDGTQNFSGRVITLGDDIDLLGYEWTPIGGADTSNVFAGTFDGAGYTVSGLSISRIAPTPTSTPPVSDSYGLFGKASGTIQNFTLTGIANPPAWGDVSTGGSVDNVGAAVGSTTGSVYAVKSSVEVYIIGTNTRNTGGIVGLINNAGSGAALYVEYCVNTGDLTAHGSFGGIVGQALSANNGGVVIDQSYNTGAITAYADSGNLTYVGGVVGYCQGYIENCYNTGTVSADIGSASYHLGGIVGLLYGNTAVTGGIAKLRDSYNTGTVTGNPSQIEPLWAGSDGSSAVTVDNCIFLAGMSQDRMNVTLTNVWSISATTMASSSAVDDNNTLSSVYFSTGDPSPTLKWVRADAVGPVYVDPNATATGTGSPATPYNDFALAVTAQDVARSTIYILNPVTVDTGTVTLNAEANIERVVRWTDAAGALITITGGTVEVDQGTVDNNGSTDPVFNVTAPGILSIAPVAGTPPTGTFFNINGTIYLVDEAAINIGATIANIDGGLVVESDAPDDFLVIANGVKYTLDEDDAAKCSYVNGGWTIALDSGENTLYLVTTY
jgi:hypothetical protein